MVIHDVLGESKNQLLKRYVFLRGKDAPVTGYERLEFLAAAGIRDIEGARLVVRQRQRELDRRSLVYLAAGTRPDRLIACKARDGHGAGSGGHLKLRH